LSSLLTYAGIKKLTENGDNVEHIDEEANNDENVVHNIPTVLADDTLSQVSLCYTFLTSILFCYISYEFFKI